MKITICIGSSCHVKGSRQVLEKLQALIAENNIGDKIELSGTFCVGQCQKGVCVLIDEEVYSVSPETVEEFFNNSVLPNLK
ncbi:MAG: NAD(P)H-dependent oxidoreductase subunit E [Clostridia bacterium]|nr:NAD(P)H-dependent oxidoreductase subunit E [Clostridia bacterium]